LSRFERRKRVDVSSRRDNRVGRVTMIIFVVVCHVLTLNHLVVKHVDDERQWNMRFELALETRGREGEISCDTPLDGGRAAVKETGEGDYCALTFSAHQMARSNSVCVSGKWARPSERCDACHTHETCNVTAFQTNSRERSQRTRYSSPDQLSERLSKCQFQGGFGDDGPLSVDRLT
jgi:hypothetical protein